MTTQKVAFHVDYVEVQIRQSHANTSSLKDTFWQNQTQFNLNIIPAFDCFQMLVVIVVVFLACWSPRSIYTCIKWLSPRTLDTQVAADNRTVGQVISATLLINCHIMCKHAHFGSIIKI